MKIASPSYVPESILVHRETFEFLIMHLSGCMFILHVSLETYFVLSFIFTIILKMDLFPILEF